MLYSGKAALWMPIVEFTPLVFQLPAITPLLQAILLKQNGIWLNLRCWLPLREQICFTHLFTPQQLLSVAQALLKTRCEFLCCRCARRADQTANIKILGIINILGNIDESIRRSAIIVSKRAYWLNSLHPIKDCLILQNIIIISELDLTHSVKARK